jgi:hydroxymethylpyrimidine/phosphomethylpyrimidine kinase
VRRVDAIASEAVVAQIQAVVEDIGVQAAKTGMLLNQEIISAVAQQITAYNLTRIWVSNTSINPPMEIAEGIPILPMDLPEENDHGEFIVNC